MTPFLIETDRLLIRRYHHADVAAVLPILSDPLTMQFWPAPFAKRDVKQWIQRSILSHEGYGFSRYPVLLRTTEEVIGDCGILKGEVNGRMVYDLGYIIHHPCWGQGYATEASLALKSFAFKTLGLDALHANMPHDHHASRRVAEKLGMIRIDEFENPRNRHIRTLVYAIQRSKDAG